jgi:hypothetical protein
MVDGSAPLSERLPQVSYLVALVAPDAAFSVQPMAEGSSPGCGRATTVSIALCVAQGSLDTVLLALQMV